MSFRKKSHMGEKKPGKKIAISFTVLAGRAMEASTYVTCEQQYLHAYVSTAFSAKPHMHGREYSIISTFRRNSQGFVYINDDSTFV